MSQQRQAAPREAQATEVTYKVVLRGIQPNIPATEAKTKLAALFKTTVEQIDKLLLTPGYVVKKALSLDIASKYKSAIEATGAVCDLVQEPPHAVGLDVDLPDTQPRAATPASNANQEIVLFQGDASLVKSAFSIVQGNAVGTNQKFVFSGDKKGDIILQRADILSAEEVKHGLGTKWAVKTKAGDTYQFIAANAAGLRQTMLTLTGQEGIAQVTHKQPELSAVKNGTAWLAAFGPTLSGAITMIVLYVLNGGISDSWSATALLTIAIFKLVLIHLFMKIDHLKLQSQGFNLQQLGVSSPVNIFTYLFSRAKAFGHGKAYAITWCVTFAVEAFSFIAG